MSAARLVRLDVRDSLLCEALADLVTAAGHRVLAPAAGRPTEASDLVITAEAPDATWSGRPGVLALRPAAGQEASADPLGALQHVLAEGGLAVWDAPLDARRLLEALGPAAGPAPGPDASGLAQVFATSAEPWLLVDAAARTARPLNRAAAEGLGVRTLAVGEEIARVAAEPEGLRRVTSGAGEDSVLWWWSPQAGMRLLGWLAWPRIQGLEDLAHLRALADLGRISSTFAHEVRNPLAALTSALDLLGRPLEPTERAEVLQLARSRLLGLRTLLDDTLRLVRAFRGEPQPVDVSEVVASALALARSDAEFHAIELACDLPAPCPEALSYAEPLRQALTNLLLNAAQAQGGRGRIRIEAVERGRRVVLAVEDQGPGIPADQRGRIFEPFWTTKAGGTGLGLVFVRRLAEASHGRVVVGGGGAGA